MKNNNENNKKLKNKLSDVMKGILSHSSTHFLTSHQNQLFLYLSLI